MLVMRTLGGLALEKEENPGTGAAVQRAPLTVLSFIAAAGDLGVSRDRIAGVFWPESDTEHARGSLKQALYSLRRSLGSQDLTIGTTTIKLNPSVIRSDIGEFLKSCQAGDWEKAAALYGGTFLDGIHLSGNPDFERWADGERRRLAGAHAAALEKLARRAESAGDLVEAVKWWGRLSATDMMNARIAGGYMQALAASGDREGAIRHATLYESLVRAELEVEPDPVIAEIVEEIRRAPIASSTHRSAPRAVPEGKAPSAPSARQGVSGNLGKLAAIGALAIATGGVLAILSMRTPGRAATTGAGRLAASAQLLVGDFVADPKDSLTARALTELFRSSIGDSKAMVAVSRSDVDRALRLMQLPVSTRLDGQLARELAERNGYEGILEGTVARVGSGFVVSVRLATAGGRDLATLTETAGSPDALIPAVGRLSKALRLKIGESAATIDSVRPLAEVTTPSLPALQLFTQAQDETREGRGESALTLSLLRDAIAEDSSFAMAHRFLGIKLYLIGSTQEAIRSLRRAERFSGRLTEIERLQAMSTLHLVLLDYARSADEARRVLGLQPHGLWALNQLGIVNFLLGRYDDGMEIARLRGAIDQGGDHGPVTAFYAGNPAAAFAQARRNLDKDQPTSHRAQWARQLLAALHAASARYDSAEHYAGSVSESIPGRMEVLVSSQLARGHIRRSLVTAGVSLPGIEPRAFERVDVAFMEGIAAAASILILDDRRAASLRLNAAMAHPSYRDRMPAERPIGIVLGLALAGRPGDARREYGAIVNAADSDMKAARRPELSLARGAVALSENRLPDALGAFRDASRIFMLSYDACRVCALPWLGRAYEAAGQPDSALSVYERFLFTGDVDRSVSDGLWRAVILRRLGELHAARGDTARALAAFGQFVAQWKTADAELQPQVDSARRRIASLRVR